MLEINTIQEFLSLPTNLQAEIQKSLRTKDRLEEHLRSAHKKVNAAEVKVEAGHWDKCPCCKSSDYPGYIWIEQDRDDNDIHPSQIHKCIKTIWYACNGYTNYFEEDIEPRLQLIFELGHSIHDIFQKHGKNGAWSEAKFYQKEVQIDPNQLTYDGYPALPIAHHYWIRGACDAIIDRYVCRDVPGIGDVTIRVAHEYKSTNSGKFSKLIRPTPEHKFQATIYAAVFNVPIVVYLYLNKDNCHMADFPVPFDHLIWNEITKRCDLVKYYTDINQQPPWEETSAIKDPQECLGCGYKKLCAPPMIDFSKQNYARK